MSEDLFESVVSKARSIEGFQTSSTNAKAGGLFLDQNRIVMQGVEGRFPRKEDGSWDWDYKGPKNDREWAWMMNRHRVLLFLAAAGEAEIEGAYPLAEDLLKDWITHRPPPGNWSFSNSWRALEVARRITDSWGPLLARSDILSWVSPELKTLWIDSLVEHGKYLRRFHHFEGNHLITEMDALLAVAFLLEDIKDTQDWRAYAIQTLSKELDKQFFADGFHRELSNHYHILVLDALIPAAEIEPEEITQNPKWTAAWQALIDMTQPSGLGPINNDSDLENNCAFLERNERWLPQTVPSVDAVYFREPGPSGQFITRNDGASTPWWLLADFGPYGVGHQHEDRLHISWAVGNESVLVDTGRYHYLDDKWRHYFRKENAHNTLTLNRAHALQPTWGKTNNPKLAKDSHSGGNADWSWATAPKVFNTFWGITVVYRTVIAFKSGEILVLDHRDSSMGGGATTLWNFHPNCIVEQLKDMQKWSLRSAELDAEMTLAYPTGSSTELLKGQETPFIAGWYAPDYNVKIPCYQLRAHFPKNSPLHVWRLTPHSDESAIEVMTHMDGKISIHWPQPTERNSILIDQPGGKPYLFTDR